MIPLELTFRHMDKSPALQELIEDRVQKLEQLGAPIMRCRVVVERPNRNNTSGSPYRVRVDLLTPPSQELVIDEKPRQHGLQEPLEAIIRQAFDTAERQVLKTTERKRRDVKQHEEQLALVIRKFDDRGYGFLRSTEGEELYFHENSVLHHGFARLDIGTLVRYEMELGEKGPQATSVQVVSKPGNRPKDSPIEPPEAGWL